MDEIDNHSFWHSDAVGGRPPHQNAMRRILEHYFKFFGGVTPESTIEKFDGQDKLICGSLFSWINDGSHLANDDLYMSCDPGQVDRYLEVFQRIFEESGHDGHYKMMMGNDYAALPAENEEPESQPVIANDSVAETASSEFGLDRYPSQSSHTGASR